MAMLICILLGVFFGSSEIPGDMNSGLVMVLLSKPISRARYLFGKYLATLIISVGIFVVIEIALIISHFVLGTGGASDYSFRQILRQMIPPSVLFVSESGVESAGDVSRLRKIGADAVLIGETLMRAEDKKAKLLELKGEV